MGATGFWGVSGGVSSSIVVPPSLMGSNSDEVVVEKLLSLGDPSQEATVDCVLCWAPIVLVY